MDHLIISTDLLIPCLLVKVYIPGGVETAVSLGVQSWFADVGV